MVSVAFLQETNHNEIEIWVSFQSLNNLRFWSVLQEVERAGSYALEHDEKGLYSHHWNHMRGHIPVEHAV